jgi:NAD+ synthase
MKIILCQLNNIVGDIAYNANKITESLEMYKDYDLLVFPELFLTGYPLQDLVDNTELRDKTNYFMEEILKKTVNYNNAILFGAPVWEGGEVYNAAILIKNGKILGKIFKKHLPNYGVFNESRNFTSSDDQPIVELNGKKIAVLICEDMWFEDVIKNYDEKGPDLIIAINASPFDIEKSNNRKIKAKKIVEISKKTLIYLNLFGAQDELVFDGGSFVMAPDMSYIIPPQYWQEKYIDFSCSKIQSSETYSQLESIYQALILSLKDYLRKNNFQSCIVGLSGGVDSALVSAIIADAIGGDKLHAVMMPTKFTSEDSIVDAELLAKNIACRFDVINIDNINNNFIELLNPLFHDLQSDITEENLQARIRGVLLMALSNKFKSMLVATSNKSEAAMGYATLYGDMCGSFSLIKDIYKTTVYELVNWRNNNIPRNSQLQLKNIIPTNIITREPSAELNFNQKDSDSLPPYDLLDKILYQLIEQDSSCQEIARNLNIDIPFVQNIKSKLIKSEFKRAQAAIGPKITTKAFNSERKYPITII